MAKKRKAAKKAATKNTKKKVVHSKGSTGRLKLKRKAAPKPKPKRASSRAVEPSSGSTSSSLDPRRVGRLRFHDAVLSARRRRIGDLQRISMRDRADSESVGELLEEGQTLE